MVPEDALGHDESRVRPAFTTTVRLIADVDVVIVEGLGHAVPDHVTRIRLVGALMAPRVVLRVVDHRVRRDERIFPAASVPKRQDSAYGLARDVGFVEANDISGSSRIHESGNEAVVDLLDHRIVRVRRVVRIFVIRVGFRRVRLKCRVVVRYFIVEA